MKTMVGQLAQELRELDVKRTESGTLDVREALARQDTPTVRVPSWDSGGCISKCLSGCPDCYEPKEQES